MTAAVNLPQRPRRRDASEDEARAHGCDPDTSEAYKLTRPRITPAQVAEMAQTHASAASRDMAAIGAALGLSTEANASAMLAAIGRLTSAQQATRAHAALRTTAANLMDAVERDAAERAYSLGLGVSEWSALLPPRVLLALETLRRVLDDVDRTATMAERGTP